MAEKRRSGKLAVILHADIAGSTSLVHQDEHLAHERIQDAFQRCGEIIRKYHGHVRELRGDAVLAEFGRASDGVSAALAFQSMQVTHNEQLDGAIRPEVRIGIAMGEVIVSDNTVTGGGVVLAQRVEQLAEPGGLCVTAAIHEALPQRMPFTQARLGEQQVKGFDEPVRVYRVELNPSESIPPPQEDNESKISAMAWRVIVVTAAIVLVVAGGAAYWFKPWLPEEDPASVERMAFPLPDKPSIAVLPFDNLSGDSGQNPLVDAITDNIITTIARMPHVFVIAKHSTLPYKNEHAKLREIAEELGIRYLLKGSFQRAGNKVRVTAQLSDALSGRHLWVERYDRETADIFDIQDDIALKVATALQVVLSEGEKAEILRPPTNSLEAWNLAIEAQTYSQQWTAEGKAKARELFTRAVDLDPDFLGAWTGIGWAHWSDFRFGWSDSPKESLEQAVEAAERALSIDTGHPDPYSLLEGLYLIKGEYDKALTYGSKALALNPNNADNLASHAITQYFAGELEQAELSVKRAMRLNPSYPPWYLLPLQEAYRLSGRYDQAIETIQEELRRLDQFFTRTRLALYYAQSGQDEKARAEIARVLQAKPDMNIRMWVNAQYFKDPKQNKRDAADLKRVGLTE